MKLNLDKLRARGIEVVLEPSGAYRIPVECLVKLPSADLRSLTTLLKDAVEGDTPIKALLDDGILIVPDEQYYCIRRGLLSYEFVTDQKIIAHNDA